MLRITIESDAVESVIANKLPENILNYICDSMSYNIDLSAQPHRFSDIETRSFFDIDKQSFPAGFLAQTCGFLKSKFHIEVQNVFNKILTPLGGTRPKVNNHPADSRYDFHYESSDKLIAFQRGVIQIATGGGKSNCALICIERIKRPTLFLTRSTYLMRQMQGHIEKYLEITGQNCDVGVLGDGEWCPQNWINVGMVQTIAPKLLLPNAVKLENDIKLGAASKMLPQPSKEEIENRIDEKLTQCRKEKKETEGFLSGIEFCIPEEAHESSGFQFTTALNNMNNAYYRMGLTATPFMKNKDQDNMRLTAACGPVIFQKSEKDLIDCGILAKPYFHYFNVGFTFDKKNCSDAKLKQKNGLEYKNYSQLYKSRVIFNFERTKKIVEVCKFAQKHKLPMLVLIKQDAHGKLMRHYLEDSGIRCEFISGRTKKTEERQDVLKKLSNGELDTVIGSTILDVGVDVPSISVVALCGGDKEIIGLRQRVGRALREKKNGPNIAFIFDFIDISHPTLSSHSYQRKGIIKRIPGFGENIVSSFEQIERILSEYQNEYAQNNKHCA